jgi:type 1 glutamine amidotransferase
MRLLLVLVTLTLSMSGLHAQNKSILIIVGGHSFDTLSFTSIFDKIPDFGYDMIYQPEANRIISESDDLDYDLLVFYDMWEPISETEKEGYLKLTEIGVPMLFLHHSLASYQQWPVFEQIIGGKYVQPSKIEDIPKSELSTYKHDVWVDVEVVDDNHPVTKGIQNFRIFDEVYGNYRVGENVRPLLRTNHPESSPIIAWENKYNQSVILYIQPGHGKEVYENILYQKLIARSLKYLAGIK